MTNNALTTVGANGPATEMVVHEPRPSDLAKALAAARDKCQAAAKDTKNKFHNYNYASADGVIAAAKAALADSGLSLVPSCPKLRVLGSGNLACYSMVRKFALIHSSGETLPLDEIEWPVIPEKGRPLDKAFAIALTSSLAYLYRDLLAMPRLDEDDMSARDDRSTQPTPPPSEHHVPAPEQAATPSPASYQTLHAALAEEAARPTPGPAALIDDRQYAEIVMLVQETGTDLNAILKHYQIPVLKKLPVEHYAAVRNRLLEKKSSMPPPAVPVPAQPQGDDPAKVKALQAEIDSLAFDKLKLPAQQFKDTCKAIFGTDNVATLKLAQLVDLRDRLAKKVGAAA